MLKSSQSFKSKTILEPKRRFSLESLISVLDNIESHDMPLHVGHSLESPPGIPLQSDRTPSYCVFGLQRTDYDLRPRHNMFTSFAGSD